MKGQVLGIWRQVEDYPYFLYGTLGNSIRGMIRVNPSDGSTSWCVMDYHDGTEERRVVGKGCAQDTDAAVQVAEVVAATYKRESGKPRSSTERNRLRLERLIAKEVAADLATRQLLILLKWARDAEQLGVARQVEAILRMTALTAFATYCRRAIKGLLASDVVKQNERAKSRIEICVTEIEKLSESAHILRGDALGDGALIAEDFNKFTNELRQYGLVAESSLVSAVQTACSIGRIPLGTILDKPLQTVHDFDHPFKKPVFVSEFDQYLERHNDFYRKEDEFRYDLVEFLSDSKEG